MKKRKRIVYTIFITVIILTISIVPVSANTVDVNVTGSYTSYSYSHGAISGSTVGFTGILSNIAHNVVYTNGIYEYAQSIYSSVDNMYRNCLTPITTNVSYYLPTMNSNLQTIGISTDAIKTDASLIKQEMVLCKQYLASIDNKLTNTPYIDPTINADEKNTVSNTISMMLGIIPRDVDDNNSLYALDITTLLGQWSNDDEKSLIQQKSTGYYNLYTNQYE